MGNLSSFFGRARYEGEDRSAHNTPIADQLEQNMDSALKQIADNALKQIAEPYRSCIDTFRQKEQRLNSKEDELNNKQSLMDKEWQKLEAEKEREKQSRLSFTRSIQRLEESKRRLEEKIESLQSENHHLKKELQELKIRMSASRESRKINGDIRPGDITHEDLSAKFQEYFDAKYRTLLTRLNYKSKEERCVFLTSVLQVATQHCNSHVIQQLSQELCALQRPPVSPRVLDPYLPNPDQIPEKWRDRSAAFGLLLSVADMDPKQHPELIKNKILQELLLNNEPFRAAHDSNPHGAEQILESALNIAWVMSTLVPPAVFHEPPKYHKEWHELVSTPGTDVDPETDECVLTYCRPVMFFGAEGTVGKVGAVKCLLGAAPPQQRPEETKKSQAQPLPIPLASPTLSTPHSNELPPDPEIGSEDNDPLVQSNSSPELGQNSTLNSLQSTHSSPPNQAEASSQDLAYMSQPQVEEVKKTPPSADADSPSTHANSPSRSAEPNQLAKFPTPSEISDASEKEESILSSHGEKLSVSAEEDQTHDGVADKQTPCEYNVDKQLPHETTPSASEASSLHRADQEQKERLTDDLDTNHPAHKAPSSPGSVTVTTSSQRPETNTNQSGPSRTTAPHTPPESERDQVDQLNPTPSPSSSSVMTDCPESQD